MKGTLDEPYKLHQQVQYWTTLRGRRDRCYVIPGRGRRYTNKAESHGEEERKGEEEKGRERGKQEGGKIEEGEGQKQEGGKIEEGEGRERKY